MRSGETLQSSCEHIKPKVKSSTTAVVNKQTATKSELGFGFTSREAGFLGLIIHSNRNHNILTQHPPTKSQRKSKFSPSSSSCSRDILKIMVNIEMKESEQEHRYYLRDFESLQTSLRLCFTHLAD